MGISTSIACIVGLSPSSRDLVFLEPEGTEIWSLNNGHLSFNAEQMQRFTKWFQIHPRSDYEANNIPQLGHAEWLKTCKIPVLMEQVWEDIPTSIRFPREGIVQALGYDYFTSTIAYMIAYAIYQDFKELHLYGVDMAAETEYFQERPCVEFWLGVAHAKGIQIIFPENSPVLKGRDYGRTVDIPSPMVNKYLRIYEDERESARASYNQATGRVGMIQDMLEEAEWLNPAVGMLMERLKKAREDDLTIKGLDEYLLRERWELAARAAEFNVAGGGARAVIDVLIEALRPQDEEAKRLRKTADEIINPGFVISPYNPRPSGDGVTPRLMESKV